MSRCFPYTPPGYEGKSDALDEALINSIKLQKEKKAKKERKKEKREKKEKWGVREKKAREKGCVEEKQQKHEKRHKNERSKVELEGDHPRREEAEHFEKSGLTEEHGQPVSSQNLYDSSDSTQNSHKRKKHCSPCRSNRNLGSILRIRLKPKDQETFPSKELPCSNSGKADHILQGKYEIPPRLCQEQLYSMSGRQQQCSTSGRAFVAEQESLKQKDREIPPRKELPQSNLLNAGPVLQGKYGISPRLGELQTCSTLEKATVLREGCEYDPRPMEEQTCSTSGRVGVQVLDIAESSHRSSRKLKKIEAQYRELIENWVPPIIESSLPDFDDQEWLLATQSKTEREAKRFKPSNDGVRQGSSSLWPQACYLPEAAIYALPYTVPF